MRDNKKKYVRPCIIYLFIVTNTIVYCILDCVNESALMGWDWRLGIDFKKHIQHTSTTIHDFDLLILSLWASQLHIHLVKVQIERNCYSKLVYQHSLLSASYEFS